jgi:hypothetical protein
LQLQQAEQTQSGPYQEITAHLRLTPPAGATTRQFVLHYDAVLHQVVTHKVFISLRQDWAGGRVGDAPMQVGVIAVDTATNRIAPFTLDLGGGGWWPGVRSLLLLGMRHIREGTDHLLFLLVLLLPAALTIEGGRWGAFGGSRYAVLRLLQIVSAFTIGHSLTLALAAVGAVHVPQQPIELLIAVSILLSAAHAIRPIFPGRELYVAAGFGLVHGLAFATVLSELHLSGAQLASSLLAFNVGMEVMQLGVVTLTLPWLILLAISGDRWVRVAGSIVAAGAAVAWIVERASSQPNTFATLIQRLATERAHYALLALAIAALASYAVSQRQQPAPTFQMADR